MQTCVIDENLNTERDIGKHEPRKSEVFRRKNFRKTENLSNRTNTRVTRGETVSMLDAVHRLHGTPFQPQQLHRFAV